MKYFVLGDFIKVKFFENEFLVELLSLPLVNDAAVRVGFAQAQADGQCPVGYDDFGYSIRSKKGTVFHASKGKSYTTKREGFDEGDIIGCEIFIPKGWYLCYGLETELEN